MKPPGLPHLRGQAGDAQIRLSPLSWRRCCDRVNSRRRRDREAAGLQAVKAAAAETPVVTNAAGGREPWRFQRGGAWKGYGA